MVANYNILQNTQRKLKSEQERSLVIEEELKQLKKVQAELVLSNRKVQAEEFAKTEKVFTSLTNQAKQVKTRDLQSSRLNKDYETFLLK